MSSALCFCGAVPAVATHDTSSRFDDSINCGICRARQEQNCFDHTDGYDSLTTERSTVFRPSGKDLGGVPASAHAIIQKDKNTTLIQVAHLD